MALFGRSLVEGVDIPLGKYVAGKDIPSGGYILSYDGNNVTIIVKTWLPDGENVDVFETLASDGSLKIRLDDGMALELMSFEKVTDMIMIKSFVGFFMK